MRITDLTAFRADFEADWMGAEALFYEGNRDAIAHVRLLTAPMSAAFVSFRFEVLQSLGPHPLPSEPLEVGGQWEHVSAGRLYLRGSGMIGGWWVWKTADVIDAVLAGHRALASDHTLNDRARMVRLKRIYQEATAPYRR